ncbi:nitroreductase family protein [Cellulosilyticum sp. I15G10I2]|uniref:nitroreductase family protein n=1 Tax=Cellulosilyticum sp. I15G10I2 TaxID=1892843 RepID=UPI00085CD474|nr:nitroreductase family protein [Cellulosilyticum sp. I15G10I2]
MSKDFYTAVEKRRSIYSISKESTISDERISEIIGHAIKHTPSAFNSQSSRVIVLLSKNHDKLWDLTKEALKKVVPLDQFAATEEKINSFQNGYGTVLFFEDQAVIHSLQQQFALYKDNFPIWSQQSSGMLQYVVWNALEIEGLGASLQHYSPLIDDDVKKEWRIPDNWKLIAQMPFGKPTAAPSEKSFQPVESRLKVFK